MFEIRQIDSRSDKSHICDAILHSLPKWFGVEASIRDYVKIVASMPFWTAFDGDRAIGFVALKIHNAYTAEICVMGHGSIGNLPSPRHRQKAD